MTTRRPAGCGVASGFATAGTSPVAVQSPNRSPTSSATGIPSTSPATMIVARRGSRSCAYRSAAASRDSPGTVSSVPPIGRAKGDEGA